ncbi:MAG: hypothetical protein ABH848_04720 [Candidatus Omnitrophota bacterium]
MLKKREAIKNKAKEIITKRPDLIKESRAHRPDSEYVKVGKYRVYFEKEHRTGNIMIEDKDIYQPPGSKKNKNSILKLIFISSILFLLRPFINILSEYRRKKIARRFEKIKRSIKDPWTYERFLFFKPIHLITLVVVSLLAISFFMPNKETLRFPMRMAIAVRFKINPFDVIYRENGWYEIKKKGIRVTAIDNVKEPLTIYVNPKNWLDQGGPSAIIEREKRIGSDGRDYGVEKIPIWVKGSDFWIEKDDKKYTGTIKDREFWYSGFEGLLGSDKERAEKIRGEDIEEDEQSFIIRDIH